MFLTAAEIQALTKKKVYAAQRKALIQMGIDHLIRPDGSPVVARSCFEATAPEKPIKTPNFDALR